MEGEKVTEKEKVVADGDASDPEVVRQEWCVYAEESKYESLEWDAEDFRTYYFVVFGYDITGRNEVTSTRWDSEAQSWVDEGWKKP
jgi:hypothetical protein